MIKWDVIKKKKEEFLALAIERNKRRIASEWWLKNAFKILFLRFVFDTYSDVRLKVYVKK